MSKAHSRGTAAAAATSAGPNAWSRTSAVNGTITSSGYSVAGGGTTTYPISGTTLPAAPIGTSTVRTVITKASVSAEDDACHTAMIRRIVGTVRRACIGAMRWCDTYGGRDNVQDLWTFINETRNYVQHIEYLLSQEPAAAHTSLTSATDASAAIVDTKNGYKFPDREMMALYKELEWIANIPANSKLLVHARRYQDVSTLLGWLQTKLSRTFLYETENQTASENYIKSYIQAALKHVKRWQRMREQSQATRLSNEDGPSEIHDTKRMDPGLATTVGVTATEVQEEDEEEEE